MAAESSSIHASNDLGEVRVCAKGWAEQLHSPPISAQHQAGSAGEGRDGGRI